MVHDTQKPQEEDLESKEAPHADVCTCIPRDLGRVLDLDRQVLQSFDSTTAKDSSCNPRTAEDAAEETAEFLVSTSALL